MLHRKKVQQALSDFDTNILNQWVDIFDKKINTVVYELYGLTADEVKIVEGKR